MLTVRWLVFSVVGLISLASVNLQSQPAIDKRVAALETSQAVLMKRVTALELLSIAPTATPSQVVQPIDSLPEEEKLYILTLVSAKALRIAIGDDIACTLGVN